MQAAPDASQQAQRPEQQPEQQLVPEPGAAAVPAGLPALPLRQPAAARKRKQPEGGSSSAGRASSDPQAAQDMLHALSSGPLVGPMSPTSPDAGVRGLGSGGLAWKVGGASEAELERNLQCARGRALWGSWQIGQPVV